MSKPLCPPFDPKSFQIVCHFATEEFPYRKHIHYIMTESENITINHKTVKEIRTETDIVYSKNIFELSCSAIEFALLNAGGKGRVGMSDLYVSNRKMGVSIRLEKTLCDEGPWRALCDALKVNAVL